MRRTVALAAMTLWVRVRLSSFSARVVVINRSPAPLVADIYDLHDPRPWGLWEVVCLDLALPDPLQ